VLLKELRPEVVIVEEAAEVGQTQMGLLQSIRRCPTKKQTSTCSKSTGTLFNHVV